MYKVTPNANLVLKKLVRLLLLVLFFSKIASAQYTIKTMPVYKQKVSYEFTDEWQYLSTDLYLFNTEKFSTLVNDLNTALKESQGKKWRPFQDTETIEYLFITANIKDVKFFGGEMTYPLYNFRTIQDGDQYITPVTSSAEVIRLLDNLPLVSTTGSVDAVIEGEIITTKNLDLVNQIVASQLQNIANITNPSDAIFALVGEFGKFMESKSKGKQYKFNSTIRLYETKDFNQRLYSVAVYVFAPSSIYEVEFNTQQLSDYIINGDNPTIDYQTLMAHTDYSQYPYIVIVNYRSKYITEQISGDEVNFEAINKRRQRAQNAYEKELMNKESYVQEHKFIDYLETFARLKMNIDNYKLNYKNQITADFTKNYLMIIQEFYALKELQKKRDIEFRGLSLYENDFKPMYEGIMNNAEFYLEDDNNLKNLKEIVNTIFLFKNNPPVSLTAEQRENYLRILYSINLPESENPINELKAINNIIWKLEQQQYAELYVTDVYNLNTIKANETSKKIRDNLKTKLKTTNCRYCRQKVSDAILDYDERYQEHLLIVRTQEYENIVKEARKLVYQVLITEECFKQNVQKQYPDTIVKPAHIQLLICDFEKMQKKREELQTMTQTLIDYSSISFIEEQIKNYQAMIKIVSDGYLQLCQRNKELCDCK